MIIVIKNPPKGGCFFVLKSSGLGLSSQWVAPLLLSALECFTVLFGMEPARHQLALQSMQA